MFTLTDKANDDLKYKAEGGRLPDPLELKCTGMHIQKCTDGTLRVSFLDGNQELAYIQETVPEDGILVLDKVGIILPVALSVV